MVEFALPEFQRMNGYLLDMVRSSDGVSMQVYVVQLYFFLHINQNQKYQK